MQRRALLLLLGGLLAFSLAYFAINTDVGSDPKLTLVVSQVLVESGSPFLNPYAKGELLGRPFDAYLADGTILEANGRYVHYFPLGPSLLSFPIVAIARSLGGDMRTADNYALQRLLAAVTVALVYWLAFALARAYLNFRTSFILSLVAVLGSSLISTLGTALWSHNYAVLCTGGALLLIVRQQQGKSASLYPAMLGLLLFLSFLNRPSSVAFILPVLLYLLGYQRRAFAIAALTSGGLLLGYLAWNAAATGSPLPSYFSAARLQAERAPLWVGVVGNLIAPSRGLLVFSPFLLPVIAGYVLYGRKLLRLPIVWLCLVWCALQLVIIARAASWWGGWSFGPRLLTDIWPGLIILIAILWAFPLEAGQTKANRAFARIFAYTFLALGTLAAVLHIVQGLNSIPASRWNGYITPVPPPSSGTLFGDLFNWRYAQPLASNGMLCAIERDAVERYPQDKLPIRQTLLGETLWAVEGLSRWGLPRDANALVPDGANDPPPPTFVGTAAEHSFLPVVAVPGGYSAFYLGWSAPDRYGDELEIRWSHCRKTEIWLDLETEASQVVLEITGLTNGRQNVEIGVNGQAVGVMSWGDEVQTQAITFPAALLRRDGLTHLEFSFPQAHYPNWRDQRPLGLALVKLSLHESIAGEPVQPVPSAEPAAYPP